jgi:hypothetical protein
MKPINSEQWLLWWCGTLVLSLPGTTPAEEINFNRDIRPILSDNCFFCHGFDPKHREADLRLDNFADATSTQSRTPAMVPGDVEHSALWKRVNADDHSELMPPPETHKKLDAAQKEKLRRWIESDRPSRSKT